MTGLFAALSILFFMILCATKSVALGLICGLLAFGFLIATAVSIFASRYDSGSRDTGQLLSPEELRAFHEQAVARKAALEAAAAARKAAAPRDFGPPPSGPYAPGPAVAAGDAPAPGTSATDPPSPPPSA